METQCRGEAAAEVRRFSSSFGMVFPTDYTSMKDYNHLVSGVIRAIIGPTPLDYPSIL
jgi:hypothetical protein